MKEMALFFAAFMTAFFNQSSSLLAQDCGLAGGQTWSPALHNVIAGCENKLPSPDGRFVLRIGPGGVVAVTREADGRDMVTDHIRLEAPAMMSWSPKSDAFFLNDGEGSGLSSAFRFFRVTNEQVTEMGAFEKVSVSVYRRLTKCNFGATDPNVWGFGWSADGAHVFLLVQATVNHSCGDPENFILLIANTRSANVDKRLSPAAAKLRFGEMLPPAIFDK